MISRGQALVSRQFGGRVYAQKTDRRCKTCMSVYRMDIEREIVYGRTYRKIIEGLPEGHNLAVHNIKAHFYADHMSLEDSTARQTTEARALQLGKDIEQGHESLVDGITLLSLTVQKTFERIVAGEIAPEFADGIRAARILAQLGEYDQGGVDQQAIIDAFMAYHETAQELMTPEEFDRFGDLLSAHPVLNALAARFDGERAVVDQEGQPAVVDQGPRN